MTKDNKKETAGALLKQVDMNLQSIVQHLPSTDFSRLDDAYLAIDSEKGYCYSLNGTAGRIWELTAQPVALVDICLQMQREFAVEEEVCRRDVLALVNTLYEAGLLQMTENSK